MEHAHDHVLMLASLAVAFMAGFTGLTLLAGVSHQTEALRKRSVTMAAIALGGGIWSMHFVAMLGVKMPGEYFYDPVITLLSAMVAVLVVGLALLVLHFWRRTNFTITAAGLVVGIGVLAMHYIGMSGMRGAVPTYSYLGIALAIVTSLASNVGVFWLAYGRRTNRNIVLGTVFFGISVFSVHFIAMLGTHFQPDAASIASDFTLSNTALALLVSIGAFLICGAFLLSGVTFLSTTVAPHPILEEPHLSSPAQDLRPQSAPPPAPRAPEDDSRQTESSPATAKEIVLADKPSARIPYETNGRTYFIYPQEIASVRAEGHYSVLYSRDRKLFCPWSISEFGKKVPGDLLVQVHRSYLINPSFVSSFERTKDNGVCRMDSVQGLERVPVSRSRVPVVRELLGLS